MTQIKRRKNAEDGRQALIDATLFSMAEYGYHGASVRKIADSADVTASLVKHYFSGKSEMVVESYRHFKKSALAVYKLNAIEAGDDPAKRLEAFTRAIFFYNNDENRTQMKIWVSFLELVITDPDIAEIQASNYELFLQELSGYIRDIYASKGDSVTPSDVEELAIGINSVIDGLWLECSLNPSRMTPEYAVKIAFSFIHAKLAA